MIPQTSANHFNVKTYLRNCNVVPIFKNSNTLKSLMSKNLRETDSNQPCIYKVPCNGCEKVYIGETIDIERRKREHKDSIRKGDCNSAVFQHLQKTNHGVSINNTIEVTHVGNTEKRKRIESV